MLHAIGAQTGYDIFHFVVFFHANIAKVWVPNLFCLEFYLFLWIGVSCKISETSNKPFGRKCKNLREGDRTSNTVYSGHYILLAMSKGSTCTFITILKQDFSFCRIPALYFEQNARILDRDFLWALSIFCRRGCQDTIKNPTLGWVGLWQQDFLYSMYPNTVGNKTKKRPNQTFCCTQFCKLLPTHAGLWSLPNISTGTRVTQVNQLGNSGTAKMSGSDWKRNMCLLSFRIS